MVVMTSTTPRASGKGSSVSQFPASKTTIAIARFVCQDRCQCWQRLPFRGYMGITRTPTQSSILCPRPNEKKKATRERSAKGTNNTQQASLGPTPSPQETKFSPTPLFTPLPLSVSRGKCNPKQPPTPHYDHQFHQSTRDTPERQIRT